VSAAKLRDKALQSRENQAGTGAGKTEKPS
jgi:hypothetical protein